MLILMRLQGLLFMCFLALTCVRAAAPEMEPPAISTSLSPLSQNYDSLIGRLAGEGFDRAYLTSIVKDPRTQFLPDVLYTNLTSKYRDADYSRFISSPSVRQARRFLTDEATYLNGVEKLYQVDKEIIVSILYIESAFGRNAGSNIVFNVFSTLALATAPEVLESLRERIAGEYPRVSWTEIEGRAHKKAEWAYQELKSLLTIALSERADVFSIKGSWAGAFGMSQFLPSSYLHYALDGNSDGKVSLHDRYDAMSSVANYLKRHGWTMDAPETSKKEVIRQYNNSGAYTEAVLRLARLIKDKG